MYQRYRSTSHRLSAPKLFYLFAMLTWMILLSGACGDTQRGSGEACEKSPQGAGRCDSNTCLEISCPQSTGPDLSQAVCAGTACSCTATGCDDTPCGGPTADQACVKTTGNTAYCLPKTVCTSSSSAQESAGTR